MWGFQQQYEFWQSLAQDQNATNLILGKKSINLGIKKLEVELGMPPQEEERTYLTLTSTNSYPLPERFVRLIELYTTIGTQRYYADAIYNAADWGAYQRQTSVSGDQLTKVFVRPGLHTFEIYPKAATASLVMTMIYESFTKDLTAADYSTGTITTLANGGTSVTASGSTFTPAMVGRWLKTDDGNWYKISGYTSATVITLQMPYQGTSIAAGTSTFIISEFTRLPEGTHELPVYYALWHYFQGVKRDVNMAAYYKNMWEEGIKWSKAQFGSRYSSAVIPSQRHQGRNRKDPNDYPNLSGA